MDRQTPILTALQTVCGNAKARFCMPGHKGDTGFFPGEMLRLDITELPGADNLLQPQAAIAESQALHAAFIDAQAAFFTTGGSTAGNLAMLHMFRGKKVIFPRGVHLSAANAIWMFGITPVYLPSPPCDYPAVVLADDVKAALKTHRDAAAVFVTYPNYFGLCCDIEAIADIAHKASLPLLVDAAHCAHFAYSPLLPLAPSDAGADMWTESAHKTLPAMNQCACLCVGKDARVDGEEAGRCLRLVQTTSPSYPLLASMDYAYAYMRELGEQELFRMIRLAGGYAEQINALPGFTCPDIQMPGIVDRDPLKMVVDVSRSGHSGLAIRQRLAMQGVHVEAADLRSILLLLTVGDTADGLDALCEALEQIDRVRDSGLYFSPYSLPEATKFSQNSRLWGNMEKVRIERSAGLICAGAAGVYPPGEAVVQRGQVISYEIAGYLLEAKRQGFDLFGLQDDSIWVYKERA